MTHLLALLFFGLVTGLGVAAIWSVLAEDWMLVKANMPWRSKRQEEERPQPVLLGHALDQLGHA